MGGGYDQDWEATGRLCSVTIVPKLLLTRDRVIDLVRIAACACCR
jgi:hypothetical protein